MAEPEDSSLPAILENLMIDGKAAGDCTKREVLKWAKSTMQEIQVFADLVIALPPQTDGMRLRDIAAYGGLLPR